MSYRSWSSEEIDKIKLMRRSGWTWGEMAKELGDSPENVRAAYRRAIGAKHSSYVLAEESQHIYESKIPRIAVMDIETLPMLVFAWGLWEQNVSLEQIVQDSCMLSWAGRYLDDPEIMSDILLPDEAVERDTTRISQSCWDFLSKADIVVGHNFHGFDSKYINTEFLKNDLPPLKPTVIDTLLVAKQNFRFSSNKLRYINDQLGIRNKLDNDGFPLWAECSRGKQEALDKMLEYNRGDIGATEELFYKVRPYIHGRLNIGLYTGDDQSVCPVCGSPDVHQEGYYYTSAGKWPQVRCEKCKCLARTKINILTKEKKKSLLINS